MSWHSGVRDARRPRRGPGQLFTQGALFVQRLCGMVGRGRGRGRGRGGGGVRGAAGPRTSLALLARASTSRLRVQYLKDASYNEVGEYQFIVEHTIVPNNNTEN